MIGTEDRSAATRAEPDERTRLRRHAAELEALYQALPVGLAVLDREQRLVRMNSAMERISGRLAADCVGRPGPELMPGFAAETRPLVQRVIDTGVPLLDHEIGGSEEGGPGGRHWLVSYVPLKAAEGRVEAVECVVQDITDRKRVEADLLASQDALGAALAGKNLLLREMSHRVLNGFQMMSSIFHLQARGMTDAQARAGLEAAAARVQSMALVHRRLYHGQDGTVEIAEYLAGLCDDLRRAFIEGSTLQTLTVDAEPGIAMSMDQAVVVGLLVAELVTNACKYAHAPDRPGRIDVRFARAGDGHVLAVSDDGCGLPDSFDLERSRGLGMTIVRAQVRQLGARLGIDRAPPGVAFVVAIPPSGR